MRSQAENTQLTTAVHDSTTVHMGQIILIEILLHYAVAKHGISKMSAAFNSGYSKRLKTSKQKILIVHQRVL